MEGFLPAWLYSSSAIAAREQSSYVGRLWHPIASNEEVPEGHILVREQFKLPLLLSRRNGLLRCFINRCPHRGVPLAQPGEQSRACKRLICPYHGWTYDLEGNLKAAAREGEFLSSFNRQDWPLTSLECQERAGLIWVAGGSNPILLDDQLDLVLAEAAHQLTQPRRLLRRFNRPLACNWKIAHDNTLDDYHVAIAHPTTLHREQGPVRHYRTVLSEHGTLLATPWGDQQEFLTFGLAPWTHLLLWPDSRMALIQFPPTALDRCRMEVWLLADPGLDIDADAWMEAMQAFLEEDRHLVEAAQLGYASGFSPGPPHRLEARILQQQRLYCRLMELTAAELTDETAVHLGAANRLSHD